MTHEELRDLTYALHRCADQMESLKEFVEELDSLITIGRAALRRLPTSAQRAAPPAGMKGEDE